MFLACYFLWTPVSVVDNLDAHITCSPYNVSQGMILLSEMSLGQWKIMILVVSMHGHTYVQSGNHKQQLIKIITVTIHVALTNKQAKIGYGIRSNL